MKLTLTEKRSIIILIFLILLPITFLLDKQILSIMPYLRFPFLNFIMITLGNMTEWFIILAILIILILITEKRHLPKFLLSFAIAMIVTYALKLLFSVLRPETALINETGFAFPSGHSAAAFVSLPYLDKMFPKLKPLWLILVLLIAFSRIYLSVHYPSDVIAGAIIGLASAWCVIKS